MCCVVFHMSHLLASYIQCELLSSKEWKLNVVTLEQDISQLLVFKWVHCFKPFSTVFLIRATKNKTTVGLALAMHPWCKSHIRKTIVVEFGTINATDFWLYLLASYAKFRLKLTYRSKKKRCTGSGVMTSRSWVFPRWDGSPDKPV